MEGTSITLSSCIKTTIRVKKKKGLILGIGIHDHRAAVRGKVGISVRFHIFFSIPGIVLEGLHLDEGDSWEVMLFCKLLLFYFNKITPKMITKLRLVLFVRGKRKMMKGT